MKTYEVWFDDELDTAGLLIHAEDEEALQRKLKAEYIYFDGWFKEIGTTVQSERIDSR